MKRIFGALFAATAAMFAIACGSADIGDSTDGVGGGSRGGGSASAGEFGEETSETPTEDEIIGKGCAATVAPTSPGKVDIIFVIDNSASMQEEMTQIRANVNRLADRISRAGLDYRVIFIVPKATNPRYAGICVPPPLGRADCGDNPPRFFHVDQNVGSWNPLEVVLSTYDGSSVGTFFKTSSTAPPWQDKVRPDATKIFVAVTDDDSAMSAESFDRAILAKKPAGSFGTKLARRYLFHSIVSKPSAAKAPTTQKCATAAGPSIEYQRLSLLTGGIIEEVCKTDYSAVLDNLAKGIAEKVACELSYPKSDTSDPTHLVVRFTPAGKSPKNLTQVTDASKCDRVNDGWYYDDPANPTRIILCQSACATANATSGSKIEALVGCKAPAPR